MTDEKAREIALLEMNRDLPEHGSAPEKYVAACERAIRTALAEQVTLEVTEHEKDMAARMAVLKEIAINQILAGAWRKAAQLVFDMQGLFGNNEAKKACVSICDRLILQAEALERGDGN